MSNNKNSKFSSSVPCSSSSSSTTTFSSPLSSSSPKCSSSPSKSSKASIASSNLFSKNLRLLFLFLIFCLIQQNSEAFLLSHRNLFVPFASSKGAKTVLSTVINQVKENNQKKNEEEENILFSEQQKSGGHQPVRLLGFMALPEEAVKALQNQLLISSKNQKSSLTHSRRKRMHHLSILRKIGTPHGQLLLGGGNGRLFGPQKETRELKRTEPLFLVNY
ncbi:unnamed protein product [Meloidogyne enterolobii]|uniref:Uncharacterized protein n=1 Tax=Meloidogyne enterolobii TaxID=390850 RepID=A0ACB0ZZ21_MELEN